MTKKISAEEFFDELAINYDHYDDEDALETRHLLEAKKIFEKYNHREGSVLDVGCGTGLLASTLEGNFEYTGIDISQNMLQIAAQRGYKTVHKPIEEYLSGIDDLSYDFVICLSTLLCVENIQAVLEDIRRIVRKALLISLEDITDDFIQEFPAVLHNHSHVSFPDAKEDYRIFGWKTPTKGTEIYVRMVYMEK